MPPLADPVQSLLITTVFGFLTTILTLFYQGWNSSRQRRWDKEDLARKTEEARQVLADATDKTRLELAHKTDQTRVELAELVRTTAEELQRKTDAARDVGVKTSTDLHNATAAHVSKVASDLAAKVEKVGDMADIAYKEANDVNRKILELHEVGQATNARIETMQAQATSDKLTAIDLVGKDTNEQVHLLKDKIA